MYNIYFILISLFTASSLYATALGAVDSTGISTAKWTAVDQELYDSKAFLEDISPKTLEAIKSPGKKGLIIGRGNLQGVDESRITVPALKDVEWFFLDPIPEHQDSRQANCLQTKFPFTEPSITKMLQGAFDVVFIDLGVIKYITLLRMESS